ncbi:unnamed protein product [Urochloa humidicola]
MHDVRRDVVRDRGGVDAGLERLLSKFVVDQRRGESALAPSHLPHHNPIRPSPCPVAGHCFGYSDSRIRTTLTSSDGLLLRFDIDELL